LKTKVFFEKENIDIKAFFDNVEILRKSIWIKLTGSDNLSRSRFMSINCWVIRHIRRYFTVFPIFANWHPFSDKVGGGRFTKQVRRVQ